MKEPYKNAVLFSSSKPIRQVQPNFPETSRKFKEEKKVSLTELIFLGTFQHFQNFFEISTKTLYFKFLRANMSANIISPDLFQTKHEVLDHSCPIDGFLFYGIICSTRRLHGCY